MIVITNKHIENGKIKKSIIDEISRGITKVDCSNCTKLTELPNWPRVTEVNCYNCINLVELPNWSNVEKVVCWNCPKLTELPNWPNVKRVDCSYCPKLTELPNWYNVTCVDCARCNELTELPNLPNVEIVYCYDCPKLTKLPNWSNVIIIDCENSPIIEIGYMPNIRRIISDYPITIGSIKANNKLIKKRLFNEGITKYITKNKLNVGEEAIENIWTDLKKFLFSKKGKKKRSKKRTKEQLNR
jgi:hypothetical protein